MTADEDGRTARPRHSKERTTEETSSVNDASAGSRLSRRGLLAGAASSLLASGCVSRSQSLVARSKPERVTLTIKTVPADTDPRATTIARALSKRLNAVGVDARVKLLSSEELYRDVLLNQSFDLYVGRSPRETDPDFLRPLLHSRYSGEPGWANPFGYTNLQLDEELTAQRTERGSARRETLREIERAVARDQPFTVIAFPHEVRATRKDRVTGPVTGFEPKQWPLTVTPDESWATESDGGATGDVDTTIDGSVGTPTDEPVTEPSELRATLTDARITRNRNPLAAEFRTGSSLLGLVYDSLGRRVRDRVEPWLARGWEWRETSEGPRATLTLRPGLTWHDGRSLTADDVAFTYRFLADTSLGRAETPVPAPTHRGETSLVSSVTATSTDRVEIQFEPVDRRVATRAFTVPLLPEHEWRARSDQATIGGVDTGGPVTEALVWNNPRPVGSGPLRFERAEVKSSLVLRPFDDHFLADVGDDDPLGRFAGGFAFDRLTFPVVPSGDAAVKLLERGTADVTASPLSPSEVPAIGRSEAMGLWVNRPSVFYHVGFNVRRPPGSNARFRRAVAHLLDKGHLVESVFEGYARPAASPLARDEAYAPELRWQGSDPTTPFPGEDGRLDVERARELFRDAGYRYSNDGSLLVG